MQYTREGLISEGQIYLVNICLAVYFHTTSYSRAHNLGETWPRPVINQLIG